MVIGITERNKNITFDDIECETDQEREVKQLCINYVNDMPHCKNMLFTGNVGTGKTMLASAMLNELQNRRMTGAILTVRQIDRKIKKSRDFTSSFDEGELIDGLVKFDLLVIDEIGLQSCSDQEKMMMHDIIDGRDGAMKPTILISNLSGKGVGENIGERVISRLKRDLTQVKFTWGDKR